MDCTEEVAILRRELGLLVGGEQNLNFDVLQGRLMVSGSRPDVSVIMRCPTDGNAFLPADKVAVMESLVQKYGVVAMVDDGVNDAPAMARSSLGVAMLSCWMICTSYLG